MADSTRVIFDHIASRPIVSKSMQEPGTPTTFALGDFHKPDGIQLGIGLTIPSPELAQICGNSGFDFVFINMEHGPVFIAAKRESRTCTVSRNPANRDIRFTHVSAPWADIGPCLRHYWSMTDRTLHS